MHVVPRATPDVVVCLSLEGEFYRTYRIDPTPVDCFDGDVPGLSVEGNGEFVISARRV